MIRDDGPLGIFIFSWRVEMLIWGIVCGLEFIQKMLDIKRLADVFVTHFLRGFFFSGEPSSLSWIFVTFSCFFAFMSEVKKRFLLLDAKIRSSVTSVTDYVVEASLVERKKLASKIWLQIHIISLRKFREKTSFELIFYMIL